MDEPPSVDWSALTRLRDGFLAGTAGARDYWRSLEDLVSYDTTFAQRIGWKWDFVLADLQDLGWTPPAGGVLDWACGSGIAGRAYLDAFGTGTVREMAVHDRSALAMRFAADRLRQRFPGLDVHEGRPAEAPAVLLVSHVITELRDDQLEALGRDLEAATAVLWVEPGTPAASLRMQTLRERLVPAFHPVAPCVCTGSCPLARTPEVPHWCHQFAEAPSWIFTDSFWTRFGQLLEIDLRSLPLSYLVLDRRPRPAGPSCVRTLGRPDVHKVAARALVCTGEAVEQREWPKRTHPDLWRAARKDRWPSRLSPP